MTPRRPRSPSSRWLALALVAGCAWLVAGCGERKPAAGSAVAAKVNGEAVSVAQVALALQQQRGLRPDQVDAASRQVLERLIDQQLAVQKAKELDLERDPRVALQIEAARRDAIARALADRLGEDAPKASTEDVQRYYADKPALFAERRIFNLQEIAVEARPDQVPALRERLAASKNIAEFVEHLKANDIRFAGNQAVRAAEQLPLASLDAIARLKDGQAMVLVTPTGMQVILLAGSRSQPVTLEQARPAIEQFILNDRKRKRLEDEVKQLRAAAKIEYVGRFAEPAPAPASAPAAASAPLAIGSAASSALGAGDTGNGAPGR